jgi:hypothetical protein
VAAAAGASAGGGKKRKSDETVVVVIIGGGAAGARRRLRRKASRASPGRMRRETRCRQLCEFGNRNNGSAVVPHCCEDHPQLRRRCERQRHHCKRLQEGGASSLTAERIEKLQRIDFCWEVMESN